jgi:hypothetical protein
MSKKAVTALAFLLAAAGAQAQAQAPAPASPAKKELVAKILKLQQPGIEAIARTLVEQPAAELMSSAANVLPARVAKDKQDAVAKEIQADVRKYLDEAVPLVQGRAVKLAPTAIGPLIEEKFSEDELKQVIAIMESPVYSKFQKMGDDMQQHLVEKLVADIRPAMDPKVLALEQTVGKRLGITPQAAGAPAAQARPAAKPAARPASR